MELIASTNINVHDMNLYKTGIEKINKGYMRLNSLTDRYDKVLNMINKFEFGKDLYEMDPEEEDIVMSVKIKKTFKTIFTEIDAITETLKNLYGEEEVEALKDWSGSYLSISSWDLYMVKDLILDYTNRAINKIKKTSSTFVGLEFLKDRVKEQEFWIKDVKKDLIQTLDKLPAPGEPEFNIHGIKVLNPFRLPEKRIKIIVQAIDAGTKLLKRKGVEVKPFLNTIYIRPYQKGETGVGYAHRHQKKMTLVRNKANDRDDPWILIEVFIHEMGHLIEDQMDTQATQNYREPWKKIEKEVDEELIKVEGKIKGEAFKRIVQYKGDLKQVKKHFTKEQLNRIHAWLQVDGSTQYSYVTPSNFAWWFRAKKEVLPILEAIKDPELMTKYMGRMIETKGNDQKVVLEYETEFIEKFGDKSDWFFHKWTGEENKFYILWDLFKYKLKGDKTTFARESDLFKEKIKELGIPSEYGHTNEAEDWAETFLYYILAPEKLSENALYRIKRALWLTQDKNMKVIERVARSIPK